MLEDVVGMFCGSLKIKWKLVEAGNVTYVLMANMISS